MTAGSEGSGQYPTINQFREGTPFIVYWTLHNYNTYSKDELMKLIFLLHWKKKKNVWNKIFKKCDLVCNLHYLFSLSIFPIQGDQLYMAVCFWYLVNFICHWLFQCTLLYTIVHYCHFLQGIYQNNTAMFIWPLCN